MAFSSRVLRIAAWRVRSMSSSAHRASEARSNLEKILSASLSSVSPPELVSKALCFDPGSGTLTVAAGRTYHVDRNVKVVAFGKAVLGMVTALEDILGEHIAGGVASIPVGAVETATKFYPHHVPKPGSKIKIFEGAEGNLPDSASEKASHEVLSVARSCGETDLLVALVSGGGSSLLSCPVPGISLREKREAIERLSKRGANIHELNALRKAISQTKGGKLADAASPAKVVGLVLSDVIGDPLDVIASGPTVPQQVDVRMALDVMDKYGLLRDQSCAAVCRYLSSAPPPLQQHQQQQTIARDDDERVFNVVIGSNKMAALAAKEAAIGLGYDAYVWTLQLEGEASSLGRLYAMLSHHLLLCRQSRGGAQNSADLEASRARLHEALKQLCEQNYRLEVDAASLLRALEMARRGGPFCLIGCGEPTVTVTGAGKGGRSQELALACAVELDQLLGSGRGLNGNGREKDDSFLFAAVGTDGQDGPCGDAAGAVVGPLVCAAARQRGLEPAQRLLDNDSHTFFALLDRDSSGSNSSCLLRTGLTGTNVMDMHLMLLS